VTTQEWHEADQDDADRVRAWQPRTALESLAGRRIEDSLHPAQDAQEPEPDPAPCQCPEHLTYRDSLAFNTAQDAQMPPNDSDVDYLRAEIAALKAERAHTMSWYKTVCELLTEKSATIARVEKVRDDADAYGDDAIYVADIREALMEPTP